MFAVSFFPEEFVWVAHPKELRLTRKDWKSGEAVFVSGKLMDPEFVRGITGRYIPFTPALARNYERGERGRGKKRILLLRPKPGGLVLGVLLLKLNAEDIERLDRFEQVPQVRKKVSIRVTIGEFERTAVTYLLR